MTRGWLAIRYIFFEILPAFLMGIAIFVAILLMFQALRLTEFVLVHGVGLKTIFQIMLYLSISFLPVILPMSLLFSVLLTYGRLSNDSEIVAFKSLGLNMMQLTWPALFVAVAATAMSMQTSFYLGPWGNRRFEVLINDLSRQKVGATLREGVFSEGFFDLVIYANKVDSKAGHLEDVFIFDERDSKSPVTIIARTGQIFQETRREGKLGLLRLNNGNVHRTHENTYTKVDFESYDITLFDPYQFSDREKSAPSLTIDELGERIRDETIEPKNRRKLEVEYHRRWSLSFACLIFGLLGVGLGTVTNRRSSRGSGFVVCLILLIGYWVLYIGAESAARSGFLPAWLGLWAVNLVFIGIAYQSLKKSWR